MRAGKVHGRGWECSIAGFTLIELMAVVVIVAILAVIAYPAYMAQVRKARRADAVAAMATIQQAQERWRANCPCYASSLTAANAGCPATVCANTSGLGLTLSAVNYTYAMTLAPTTLAPNTYTVTATGTGSQAGDTNCTVLTVAVTNGSATRTPAACWSN
jgi:type IV pilus assembly protein PilE